MPDKGWSRAFDDPIPLPRAHPTSMRSSARGNAACPKLDGSLLVRSGDSFPVRDSGIHDFGGDHHKQNFRLGRLGGGIFCDRRRNCVAGWSRSKIILAGIL